MSKNLNKFQLGMTATPARTDGQSLKGLFNFIMEGPQIPDLQEAGILCPVRELSMPMNIDLSNVPIEKTTGDFRNDALYEKMRNINLYSEVIKEFKKHSLYKKNITYCVNIRHAMEITELYRKHGINAVCVSSFTDSNIRKQIYQDFKNNKIQVIVNCLIYTEGINIPDIESITSLRPTMSLIVYYQTYGRGVRRFPGKKECLFLDHSGNIQRHGSICDYREWPYLKKGKKKKHIIRENSDPKSKIITKYYIYDDVDLQPYINPTRKISMQMVKNIIVKMKQTKLDTKSVCDNFGIEVNNFKNFLQNNTTLHSIYQDIINRI
jgi:superfamily II DNA or RNA helicase